MEPGNAKRDAHAEMRAFRRGVLGGLVGSLLLASGVVAVAGSNGRILQFTEPQLDVGLALQHEIATFHRPALRGEEAIEAQARDFYSPEVNDAQRLSACGLLGGCANFDTGPVRVTVYRAAESPLSVFRDFTAVAGLTVMNRHKLDEWGLNGHKGENGLVAHELKLRAQQPNNAADPRWVAQVFRGNVKVKDLDVAFLDTSSVSPPTTASFFQSASGEKQIIAVKCPGGICFVGTKEAPTWLGGPEHCTDQGSRHCGRWGRFDAQDLSGDDGKGNLRRSGALGLVVPMPATELDDNGNFSNPQDFAAIRIAGKDYVTPRLTIPKDQEIMLKLWQVNSVWTGRLYRGSSELMVVTVKRHVHKDSAGNVVTPLAATRWNWTTEGEGIWVRCGSGCCEVDLTSSPY